LTNLSRKLKITFIAQHSRNQRTPQFPPSQGGTQGGVKKTYKKKKFLQRNTIDDTLQNDPAKMTEIVYVAK